MRPLLVVVAALALLLPAAHARTHAESIEGTWNYGSGQVLVRPSAGGSFTGVIVKPATFSSGCPHPVGEVMWQIRGSGTHYTGTHKGFRGAASGVSCAQRQREDFPATFDVSESGGKFLLRLCTTFEGGRVDCNTLERAKPPAPVRKTYLWGANVTSYGTAGAPLVSQTISGSGSSTLHDGRIVATRGSFRVVWNFRRPKGKKLILGLRVTGPASPIAARPGGGGTVSVRVVVTGSGFSNCARGASGVITIADRAGVKPDGFVLNVCGSKTTYLDGGRNRTRVFALVGEQRS
jgi:hypothetical protein